MKRIYQTLRNLARDAHSLADGGSLVKVYSHPRSGTHFLEAFLARNFYMGKDLTVKPIEWGHWADRRRLPEGNPFGQLFGSHAFPRKGFAVPWERIAYIYRDGWAVAYSVWRTENFINPRLRGISLSEFLRTPLDWLGTPGQRYDRGDMNIVQHWSAHVRGWKGLAQEHPNILVIAYEALKDDPYRSYQIIREAFFPKAPPKRRGEIDVVADAVGLLPNQATQDAWKGAFSESDLRFFDEQSRGG